MRNNVMFIPAVILMIAEAAAATFLVYSWFRAKREAEGK